MYIMTTVNIINNSLDILEPITEDNSIISYQYRDHTSQNQNINDHSDIIIEVNSTNSYIKPSESVLVIEGQLRKNNVNHDVYTVADEVALVNNAMMYLFNEISYSINDVEMERIKHPGQISSMLGYAKYPDDFSTSSGMRMCWSKDTTKHANSVEFVASAAVPAAGYIPSKNPEYNQGFAIRKSFLMSDNALGNFEFAIPFSHMFGFSEYNKVLWGLKHTLKLTQNSNNNLAVHRRNGVDEGEIYLRRVSWSIPYVKIEPVTETKVMSILKDDHPVPVAFSARTAATKSVPAGLAPFEWRLSVPGGVEKPRWIIVGFQTDRVRTQEQNPAIFDHLSISNCYCELNSERYPSFDITTNFDINKYSKLYDWFNNFKNEYYKFDDLVGGTQVNFSAFKSLFPIIVFDVRRQDEKLKSGVVDMNLSF